MPDPDPQELADQLERETERLQGESDRLAKEAASARADWERKRQDPNVPGAPPREDQQEDEADSEQDPETPPF